MRLLAASDWATAISSAAPEQTAVSLSAVPEWESMPLSAASDWTTAILPTTPERATVSFSASPEWASVRFWVAHLLTSN